MVPLLGKKLNASSKGLQYRVACGLKVVRCLNGTAATVDMFGAEDKDEKGALSDSDTCFPLSRTRFL
jgi:hypothetical protein